MYDGDAGDMKRSREGGGGGMEEGKVRSRERGGEARKGEN